MQLFRLSRINMRTSVCTLLLMGYSTETAWFVLLCIFYASACLFLLFHTHVHSVTEGCEPPSKHAASRRAMFSRLSDGSQPQPVGGWFHLVIPARLEPEAI